MEISNHEVVAPTFSLESSFSANECSFGPDLHTILNCSLGALFCASAEAATTNQPCLPEIHPTLQWDLATLFTEAYGLDDNAENQEELENHSLTRLSARIKILVFRALDYLASHHCTPSGSPQGIPPATQELLVLKLLQGYGFQVYSAHFDPALTLGTHSFWVVIPPSHMTSHSLTTDLLESAFVVDFHFLDHFHVARPSESYGSLLEGLREEFIGSANSDLLAAVGWLGERTRVSFETQKTSNLPWRHSSYLQSCYLRGVEAAFDQKPLPDIDVPFGPLNNLLQEHDLIFQTLGFSLVDLRLR